jgi:signal transduction histidine kinase
VALAPVAPLTTVTALWLLAAAFDAAVSPLDGSFTAIGLAFVPPFVVAALATRARAVAGLLGCLAGELLCFGPSGLADAAVIVVLAWIAGLVLHERSRLVTRLRHNAGLLDTERRVAAARAVIEERARLARELHDALGHSLTVVALQAGAARRWWDADRERSLGILETLVAVTGDGLADLRDGMGTTPRDRLADAASLAALVDRARDAGLPVVAELDDVTGLLDPEAELVVYRVLQESLTNVLRHAPGADTEVRVRAEAAHVDVTVRNAAPTGPVTRTTGSGRGLDGMLARAVASGGALDWGHQPDGGFRVRAHLPTSLPTSLVPS